MIHSVVLSQETTAAKKIDDLMITNRRNDEARDHACGQRLPAEALTCAHSVATIEFD